MIATPPVVLEELSVPPLSDHSCVRLSPSASVIVPAMLTVCPPSTVIAAVVIVQLRAGCWRLHQRRTKHAPDALELYVCVVSNESLRARRQIACQSASRCA